jgi:hypothetical protein
VRPEIPERQGAEQRLTESMREDVRVGVTIEAALEGHTDPAENERAIGPEAMEIEPEPDARHERRT